MNRKHDRKQATDVSHRLCHTSIPPYLSKISQNCGFFLGKEISSSLGYYNSYQFLDLSHISY